MYYHARLQLHGQYSLPLVELDVTEWIATGKIPKMSEEERRKLDEDLVLINEERGANGKIQLDLHKRFDDHFYVAPAQGYINKESKISSRSTSSL